MTSATDTAGMETPADPLLFGAVLHPHRSLTQPGFVVLMTAIAIVSFGVGAAFVMMGAWPVTGFFGLDVLLIYLAFRINYRRARMFETVSLTPDALTVERVNHRGRRQTWQFQPYWLRVSMDDPPQHDSALTLTSHGRSLVIGAFLSPEERLDFARALRHALDRLRLR
ncbi:MAG: DUF2244 domain-containing protein [Rhodospirillales bacterium]